VKEVLVERLASVARPHRHEDVSADELVDDLAVGRQTLEHEFVVVEWNVELFELPVDWPRLHHRQTPRAHRVARLQVEPQQSVTRHAQQLLLTPTAPPPQSLSSSYLRPQLYNDGPPGRRRQTDKQTDKHLAHITSRHAHTHSLTITGMSVFLILGRTCMPATSRAAPWRITLSMRRAPYQG